MPEPKVPINMRDKFLKEEQERKEKVASLPKIQKWKVNAIEDAQKNIEEMKSKERNKLDVYKERYSGGSANPEVKECAEKCLELLHDKHSQFNQELMLKIKN